MVRLQNLGFFCFDDDTFHSRLRSVGALVDRALLEIGLDDADFAKMASAVAVVANMGQLMMMGKVDFFEGLGQFFTFRQTAACESGKIVFLEGSWLRSMHWSGPLLHLD